MSLFFPPVLNTGNILEHCYAGIQHGEGGCGISVHNSIHGFLGTSVTARGYETTSQLQEKDKICKLEGSIS